METLHVPTTSASCLNCACLYYHLNALPRSPYALAAIYQDFNITTLFLTRWKQAWSLAITKTKPRLYCDLTLIIISSSRLDQIIKILLPSSSCQRAYCSGVGVTGDKRTRWEIFFSVEVTIILHVCYHFSWTYKPNIGTHWTSYWIRYVQLFTGRIFSWFWSTIRNLLTVKNQLCLWTISL